MTDRIKNESWEIKNLFVQVENYKGIRSYEWEKDDYILYVDQSFEKVRYLLSFEDLNQPKHAQLHGIQEDLLNTDNTFPNEYDLICDFSPSLNFKKKLYLVKNDLRVKSDEDLKYETKLRKHFDRHKHYDFEERSEFKNFGFKLVELPQGNPYHDINSSDKKIRFKELKESFNNREWANWKKKFDELK